MDPGHNRPQTRWGKTTLRALKQLGDKLRPRLNIREKWGDEPPGSGFWYPDLAFSASSSSFLITDYRLLISSATGTDTYWQRATR